MKTRGKLYALFVGINSYRYFPNRFFLTACHRDVYAMREFLQQPFIADQFAELIFHEPLLDEKAEKAAIIHAFRTHFKEAGRGDTVLFYFSGHGIRERTDIAAFGRGEIDGVINSLVCYDANFSLRVGEEWNNGKFLADKELRYLIRQIAEKGSHILTIFDNCHADSNTRSIARPDEKDFKVRQLEYRAIPSRPETEFLFARSNDQSMVDWEKLKTDPLSLAEQLPQGEHIQMAACRSWEEAYEDLSINQGVFTAILLDILSRHKGELSYHELQGRISNRIRSRDSENPGRRIQMPQIYFVSSDPNAAFRTFLGQKKPNAQSTQAAVSFNSYENEWRLNLGGIHGLRLGQELMVYVADNPENRFAAFVSELMATQSVIQYPDAAPSEQINTSAVVRATVDLNIGPLKVKFSGVSKGIDSLLLAIGKEYADQVVTEDIWPDYEIKAREGKFFVSLPGDHRSIVQPLAYEVNGHVQDSGAGLLAQWLAQMARWKFLRYLNLNPHGYFSFQYPVLFRAFQYIPSFKGALPSQSLNPADWRLLQIENNQLLLRMTHDLNTSEPFTFIGFSLKNVSDKPWFIAVFLLNASFAVFQMDFSPTTDADPMHFRPAQKVPALDTREIALPPGASVDLVIRYDEDAYFTNILEPHIPPHIIRDHWDSSMDVLKLIISDQTLNLTGVDLEMDELPEPLPDETPFDDTINRTIYRPGSKRKEPPVPPWSILTLELIYLAPTS